MTEHRESADLQAWALIVVPALVVGALLGISIGWWLWA